MNQSRAYRARPRAFAPDEADYAIQIGGNLTNYAKNERMRTPNLYCDRGGIIEKVTDYPAEACGTLRTDVRHRWPTQAGYMTEDTPLQPSQMQEVRSRYTGPTHMSYGTYHQTKRTDKAIGAREVLATSSSRSTHFKDMLNRLSPSAASESFQKKSGRGVFTTRAVDGYSGKETRSHREHIPMDNRRRTALDPHAASFVTAPVRPATAANVHSAGASVREGSEAQARLMHPPPQPNLGKHTRVEFPAHHSKKIIL